MNAGEEWRAGLLLFGSGEEVQEVRDVSRSKPNVGHAALLLSFEVRRSSPQRVHQAESRRILQRLLSVGEFEDWITAGLSSSQLSSALQCAASS